MADLSKEQAAKEHARIVETFDWLLHFSDTMLADAMRNLSQQARDALRNALDLAEKKK
ncbi:MAG: hypothetical protein Q7R74_01150 [bacterium]|nr:hypothetical protein [bacterium]